MFVLLCCSRLGPEKGTSCEKNEEVNGNFQGFKGHFGAFFEASSLDSPGASPPSFHREPVQGPCLLSLVIVLSKFFCHDEGMLEKRVWFGFKETSLITG